MPALACLSWSLWLLVGISLVHGVRLQRAPGYPSAAQLAYFVGLPATGLLIGLGLLAISFKFKGCLTSVWAGLLIVAAVPFLFFLGGGV